ncbi:MAG: hypothetical protein Fur0034_05700 [Desulfuromonadia bacterium]
MGAPETNRRSCGETNGVDHPKVHVRIEGCIPEEVETHLLSPIPGSGKLPGKGGRWLLMSVDGGGVSPFHPGKGGVPGAGSGIGATISPPTGRETSHRILVG